MVALRRRWSVFDKCRTSYQRTQVPATGERSGNSVRDSNRDKNLGLIQRPSLDFRGRCVEKLEKLGDTAIDSKKYDEAIKQYSDALTLDTTNQCGILLKRSKVRVVMGSWEEALVDADKVWILFHITLNGPR